MREADLIRLQHMLDAAREAVAIANTRGHSQFSDRILVLALVKEIEIIGEAVVKLSEEVREKYQTIPWPNIMGMRNRLIHAYFDIDNDRVWDTVHDDLPPLISELEKIISNEKAE